MIIISGYQGVGKSTFATKSHKKILGKELIVVDHESSAYNKSNPLWYTEYVSDALKKEADVLFLSSHQSVRDELNRLNIEFIFVLPDTKHKHKWTEGLAKRVQSSLNNEIEKEKNIKALMSHILYYDNVVEELKITHKPLVPSARACEKVIFIKHPSELKQIIYNKIINQSNAKKKMNEALENE